MKRLLKQIHILLLEDIPTDADLIERELQRTKIWYTPRRVDNREDFEQALQTFQPDVILADYKLPKFDGITALRIASQVLPEVPFIFVSGSISEDRAVEALRHGATDYIIKDRMQRLGPAVLRALEDVTARRERKRADSALRLSEERFRTVAAATTDGIWDWDLRADSVWLSEGLRRLFGYQDAPEFVDGNWIRSRFHPDDAAEVKARTDDYLKERVSSWELRYRFRRGDGGYALVLERSRILSDDSTRPVRVVAALSDIAVEIRVDRLQQTQFEITRLLTDAEDIDSAIPQLLKTWSEGLGGMVAAIWFVDRSVDRLRFRYAWARDASICSQVEAASRDLQVGRGEALPGRAWAQAAPRLITDLATDPTLPRQAAFVRAGLKSGFAFPITVGREVVGIIECFSPDVFMVDDLLLAIAKDIGIRIGQFLKRKGAETALRMRLQLEELVAFISEEFSQLAGDQVDPAISRALGRIGSFVGLDAAQVILQGSDRVNARSAYEWVAPQLESRAGNLPSIATGAFPWWRDKLLNRQSIVVWHLDDLPSDAEAEKKLLDAEHVRSVIAEPLAQGKTVMGFLSFQTIERERNWTEDDISLIRTVARLISNALARKAAEESLRKSEGMLGSAERQAHLGSWELDLTSNQLIWSEELYRIFGLDRPEFSPTLDSVLDRVHPEDRDRVRSHFRNATRSGGIDYRIIRPDGNVRTLQGTKNTIIDKARPEMRVVGSALDITEIRQAAQTIQRLSRQNQLILESAAEGIYGMDPDGVATLVNPAAARILGWTANELVGKRIHDVIHYAHMDGTPFPWNECLAYSALTTGITATREDIFWRKDGTSVQVEFTTTPITDQQGHRLGAVQTFRDIEQRKLLEKQLEQATRLSSLGRLAATIAHEFNNVLMGIQPFNELIRKLATADPRVQKATEQIGRSIQRGKGVTQEILRFTRPAQPNMQRIELEEWLNDFAGEMRGVLGDKIQLLFNVPAEKLVLRGDPLQLMQVFSNLVLNARDVLPNGGTITLIAEPPSNRGVYPFGIVPSPQNYVHFAVNDTGPGMSGETMTKIFEPLFTTKRTGTGLGLAVTHQIVQRHGGFIFVESELGKGSTFHVFLPVGDRVGTGAPMLRSGREGATR